jgi:acetolactate synthase-1/2/3 large subunit
MKVSGGELIAQMLQKEGVDKVFGIIDGTYFGLYSSLHKYGIELITPRHETSAAHMAGAYARITGKLGVCLASNGPGVANILPGVAVENAEGNRVMLITSARRPEIAYPDRGGTYQCFDHVGVIAPMSKYSVTVKSPVRLVESMRQGFRHSFKGRPGVVHVDVPETIMNGKFQFDEGQILPPEKYRLTTPISPDLIMVKRAAKMIVDAKRPIIHAGSGILHAQAYEELEALANLTYMPVTTSWGARGALCEENELSVPMIQVEANNNIRNDADLVLVLGSRLGETDWWGKQPNWRNAGEQKTIQVDLEEEFIGRNKPVDLAVIADVKVFLRELVIELKTLEANIKINERKSWFAKHLEDMAKYRAKLDEKLEDLSTPMTTAHVGALCKKVFSKNSVAIFDGGNTAVWGQFYYKCTTPGHGMSTPKMGMLGAGVSQTLGAQVARPDNQVYCIIGDGAMGFHVQEIETAVRNNLPVTYLVVCDKQWGMVKMSQQIALRPLKTVIRKSLDEGETINADFNEIDFAKLAESMGAFGVRVDSPSALEEALRTCVAKNTTSVIHVDVDPVKHMWAPALQAFKKMHEEPKGK